MTSFASSATSGWSQGEDNASPSFPNSPDGDAFADPVEGAPEYACPDIWYFTSTCQQLAAEDEEERPASRYGVAATTLRQRPRPASADTANLVRFNVLPSAVLTSAMTRMRREASGRSARLRERSQAATVNAQRELRLSAANSTFLTDVSALPQDGVGRLVAALNECESLQQQHQPPLTSPGPKSMHHSHISFSAASTYNRHPAATQSRRSSLQRSPLQTHVVDLTKNWVAAEAEAAAADAASAFSVQMPLHPSLVSHGAPLAHDSCVMRLRKSKFPPPRPASSTGNSTTAKGASADQTAEGQPRPASAGTLRQRILAEPIHSFQVLKDATTPPVDLYPPTHVPLLEAARMRRANLERLRHNFEHQRFALHGELEDALEWRSQCQSAVLRRRSAESTLAPANNVDTLHSSSQLTTDAVYDGLLKDLFPRRPRTNNRPLVPPAKPLSVHPPGTPFRSVWTKEAARQAVQAERARLVRLLKAFAVPCETAALTAAATEELRKETIQRVWHPEDFTQGSGQVLFYREHFLKFVQARYPVKTVMSLTTAQTALVPADVFDGLPSKAEASFAKYAYETLPSMSDT